MAESSVPLSEFIMRPDTAAITLRYNSFIETFINQHPYIRLGKLLTGNIAIAYVQRDRLTELIRDIGEFYVSILSVVLGPLDLPDLEESGILRLQQQPYLNLRGQGVLLGFIDTGIDYTLEHFRYEDGTSRIQSIWDQTIQGDAPAGYFFGAEYGKAEIDAALKSADPRAVVPHEDTVGHGTFLAGVAGGRGTGAAAGAAPDAEFVVVKLRKACPYYLEYYDVSPMQETAFESADLMLGIEYIIERAAALGRPAAVCLSVGTNSGGHDGFTIMEEYLADISFLQGVAVCAAAGNEAAARHHVQGRLEKQNDAVSIEVTAGEFSDAIRMEIWNNPADRLSVSVKSPAGEIISRLPAKSGTYFETRLVLERSIVRINYFFPIEGSSSQLTVVRVLDPTPGIWTVTLYGDIVINGEYHAWLPLTGFVDRDVEFLTPSPNCTVVVPATAIGVITCGAYRTSDKSLYPLSSWGPSRLPANVPDLTAPGVEAAGIFPGGRIGNMSGTSVAAALVTGACALMLEWGILKRNEISLNTYLIKANLIRGCDRDRDLVYPNNQWGYGRLNLYNTFYLLRGTI
ncbi:MAG: S8 family peptidase [Clostridiales bacterium]|jgi:subtilisin family serine protease|nr:S8 family peptidase [Clostridiales bacterium]